MESASNFWKDFHWYPCGRTFLIKATEKVSQETMPWSMSSTKAVSVKESRSPKLKKTRQQPLATSLPLTCTERLQSDSEREESSTGAAEEQEDMESVQRMFLSFRRAVNAREIGSRSSSGITLAEMISGIMQQFVFGTLQLWWLTILGIYRLNTT